MRTDNQIKAEAAQAGQVGVGKLQLEVLLDIRQLLARLPVAGMSMSEATGYLKTLAERWKKPGRPRKQKQKSGPKPAVQ
jgi:hypothetical protein